MSADMDAHLNAYEAAIDEWAALQRKADEAKARHKHHTAAEAMALKEKHGATMAEKAATATEGWLERETYVSGAQVDARAALMRADLAMKRFEAARSEFAAGRRVQ